MKKDKEGFLYPLIEKSKCIDCGLCERVCQYYNPYPKKDAPESCLAFVHNDTNIRMKSSSGGFFFQIASHIIKKGGVVFGAKFTSDFSVTISYAEDLHSLKDFLGSKYVQATVGDSYKEAKAFLDKDRPVLFSGTPCQINGLKHFLGKEFSNLLCIDFACHSIPSPAVWKSFISNYKNISHISFKDKETFGWYNYGLTIYGDNGDILLSEGKKDNIYMKGFLEDMFCRPSCSNCISRSFSSSSDITMGDFWNIEKYHPSTSLYNDNKGVSLVMVLSPAGNAAINELETTNSAQFEEVDYSEVEIESSHYCIVNSFRPHPFRPLFFTMFPVMGTAKAARLSLDLYNSLRSLRRKFRR